jgi:hypothetical protein
VVGWWRAVVTVITLVITLIMTVAPVVFPVPAAVVLLVEVPWVAAVPAVSLSVPISVPAVPRAAAAGTA